MPNYWDAIKQIVDESDIVLEVLDARMPQYSRNEIVEQLIKEKSKKLLFILNKSDLVNKKNLEDAKKWLRQFGDCVYVSATSKAEPKKLWGMIFKHLKKIKRERRRKWVVGFVGYPNTGKSSIINLLIKKQKARVSKKAGTTHGIQWIRFGQNIKILDSPGVIPLRKGDPIKYGLLGVKQPEKLKNTELVAHTIIKIFLRGNKKTRKNFEEFFRIKIQKNDDEEEIFNKISKSKGYLKGGGITDENRTAISLIKAWNEGRIRL